MECYSGKATKRAAILNPSFSDEETETQEVKAVSSKMESN